MKLTVKFFLIAMIVVGCNEDSYKVEEQANRRVITRTIKGKIGTYTDYWYRCEILKIRIDDDSQYHITFRRNGRIYSVNDLEQWNVTISNSSGECFVLGDENGVVHPRQFDIRIPVNFPIEYFDD